MLFIKVWNPYLTYTYLQQICDECFVTMSSTTEEIFILANHSNFYLFLWLRYKVHT